MAAMQSLWARVVTLAGGARRDEGQTMAEYGLILAGIAVVTAVAAAALGTRIVALFNTILP